MENQALAKKFFFNEGDASKHFGNILKELNIDAKELNFNEMEQVTGGYTRSPLVPKPTYAESVKVVKPIK
jgi:bacteriocin-like protein